MIHKKTSPSLKTRWFSFLSRHSSKVSFSKRKDGRKSRGKKRIVLEFEGSHPRAKDFSCNGIEKKSWIYTLHLNCSEIWQVLGGLDSVALPGVRHDAKLGVDACILLGFCWIPDDEESRASLLWDRDISSMRDHWRGRGGGRVLIKPSQGY